MTDEEYLKKMIAFTEQLERAAAARPYDRNEYNNIIETMQLVSHRFFRSRRYRRRDFILKLLFWILILAVVVLMIMC